MDEQQRADVALWRFSVLGPLISAELKHGDKRHLFDEIAKRTYVRANGRRVRVTSRTIEDWFYAYAHGGFEALKPQGRSDVGRSRVISAEVAELIIDAKLEKPRRSIRRIIRMLERAGKVRKGQLKKSTVHRLLRARGLSRRPPRTPERERRAFRHPYASDCWMGDVMHGPPVLDEHGRARKAYLHVFIDSATRLVPACAFRFGERAVDFETVLKMGVRRHGPPRMLYVDRGAAQTAESLALICAELGVRLRHCRAYDPEAKAGVERFIATCRAELIDELGEEPIELAELNGLLWAWLSTEYHSREHSGTGRVPLEHWLEQAERLRPSPSSDELDRIFLHREHRQVRRDSTIRFHGHMLEVRPELTGTQVELRYDPELPFDPADPTTLPRVYVEGRFFCDTVVCDPVRNSTRPRRNLPQPRREPSKPTGIDPLTQMADEQARRSQRPSDLTSTDDEE